MKRAEIALAGAAGLLAVLVVLPGMDPFFDPEDQIHLAAARNARDIGRAFLAGDGLEYRPSYALFLAVERWFLGERAPGYYAVSFLLHGASAGLLYSVARLYGLGALGALLAAVWFGVHPAAARVVSWLGDQNRVVVPATLTAVALWMRYGRSGRRRDGAGSTIAAGFALFAKESAALVPALLPAWELARGAQVRLRPLVPLLVLWSLYAILALRIAASAAHPAAAGYGLGLHNLTHLGLALTSLALPPGESARAAGPALFILLGIAATIFLGWTAARAPFLAIWVAVALVPVLLKEDAFRSFADGRYVYPALAPAAIGMGWLAERIRAFRPVLLAHVALLAGASLLVSARSHEHPPASVVYQYTVSSLLDFGDAEAFLAARTESYGRDEWKEVLVWSHEIRTAPHETAERARHFALVGLFAEALASARLGDVERAAGAYRAALDLVSDPSGELPLLRGRPVPNERAALFIARHREELPPSEP